jgi:anti-sigma factor RsiW
MNCNEASELLAAAVLGDLTRDEQRAVHAHLADCERCLEEEGDLFESLRLLRAHADVEPGPGFHAEVLARAAESATEGSPAPVIPIRRVGLLTQTLLTAAATALIVVGLQTALESWRTSPSASPAGFAFSEASLAGQELRTAPSLLDGTLFDRRRNDSEDLRRFQQSRRRGNDPRPLDL